MNDRAAAPLLDADAIESTPDSMAELLDLSKQQRNLLLLRPLFQLELNKRAVGKDVASENALFEGIDTHYLVLSALDFMMEGTSINLGCTHAEVLDQLAAVAQAMREDLSSAQAINGWSKWEHMFEAKLRGEFGIKPESVATRVATPSPEPLPAQTPGDIPLTRCTLPWGIAPTLRFPKSCRCLLSRMHGRYSKAATR